MSRALFQVSSQYSNILRKIGEKYREGHYREIELPEPLQECYVCCEIKEGGRESRDVLEFEIVNSELISRFFVHKECIDYLLGEAFLERMDEKIKRK